MANPTGKTLSASPPTDSHEGPGNSIFLVMNDLGKSPSTGRLLRGLTPYLDEHGALHVFLLAERTRREDWSGEEEVVSYRELVHWERNDQGGIYRGVFTREREPDQEELLEKFKEDPFSLIQWTATQCKSAVISSGEPLRLVREYVDKPWGREGWYTGIEKRGVSGVSSETGTTPLPFATGMFPIPLLGSDEPELILLKTLEPHPEQVYGDLYLEVHQEKWETYLVLAINKEAWPEGRGYLRAGLNPKVITRYRKKHDKKWEAALRDELGKKIGKYEEVRREIDLLMDKKLIDKSNPAGIFQPELLEKIRKTLPAKIRKSEEKLRKDVEGFLGLHPLQEGDVACLPPGVLHSLQHGIKVVEFQTPTYERLVAMFAQKVLTQSHWDTDEALELMEKTPYAPPEITELPTGQEGVTLERIVDFPQFTVDRFRLEPGVELVKRGEGNESYSLLFVSEGEGGCIVSGEKEYPLAREDGFILPSFLTNYTISAPDGLTFLLAYPKPPPSKPE